MKKEILWVVITTFGLGLIITYGVITARKALEKQKQSAEISEPPQKIQLQPTAEPTPPSVTLTLYQPEDESVISKKTVLCKGKSLPLAVIAILAEEDEFILEADSEGNFETEINLVDGVNEITISAFDEKGNEVSKTITLVYTEAEI